MKLVVTYGSFNPPTKSDRALFDHMGTYDAPDTEILILTDTKFDSAHPMGVLEKCQALNGIRITNAKVRMDFIHFLEFLDHNHQNYDEITFVHNELADPIVMSKGCKRFCPYEVKFELVKGLDSDDDLYNLLGSLTLDDEESFLKHYGGPDADAVHVFNALKDRVIWTDAKNN